MNFNSALKELRAMAGGRFCTLNFKVTSYDGMKSEKGEINVSAYVDGFNIHSSKTFAAALKNMKKEMDDDKGKS